VLISAEAPAARAGFAVIRELDFELFGAGVAFEGAAAAELVKRLSAGTPMRHTTSAMSTIRSLPFT
jgi:hypothetical protein